MFFTSLLLSIAVSIDALGIGITYGIRDTKISNISKYVLFFIFLLLLFCLLFLARYLIVYFHLLFLILLVLLF